MRTLVLLLVAAGALTLGGCGTNAGSSAGGPEAPVSDIPRADGSAPPRTVPANRGVVGGRVVGADGTPVVGALVTPVGVGDAPPVPEIAVLTGADGGYRWILAPGTYRMTVAPTGGTATDGGTVTVAAGGTVTLDVRLP